MASKRLGGIADSLMLSHRWLLWLPVVRLMHGLRPLPSSTRRRRHHSSRIASTEGCSPHDGSSVELQPRPIDTEEPDECGRPETVEIISDLDKYVEHTMCSCSASDDNHLLENDATRGGPGDRPARRCHTNG